MIASSSSSSRVKSSQAANFERSSTTTRSTLLIKTLTCPKNNKIFTFSFRWETHTKKTHTQKNPQEEEKKKEEKDEKDCALPSLARVLGRTPPPPVLVSMRVRWQKARCLLRRLPFRCIIVVFLPARFFGEYVSNTFTLIRRIDDDDGRQRQNLTDRLLLSYHHHHHRARVRHNRLTKAIPKAAARKTPVALAVNAELVRFWKRLVLFFFFCVCVLSSRRSPPLRLLLFF